MGYLYPTTWSLLGYTSGIDRDPLAGTPYSVREDCGNGGPISHGVPINSMDLGVAIAMGLQPAYPLVNIQKLLKMAIEMVDLPIKNRDFHSFLYVYQRVVWI